MHGYLPSPFCVFPLSRLSVMHPVTWDRKESYPRSKLWREMSNAASWSVAQVLEYLAPIGLTDLQTVEAVFVENYVDGKEFLDLSLEDLVDDLGLRNEDDVNKILEAVAALKDDTSRYLVDTMEPMPPPMTMQPSPMSPMPLPRLNLQEANKPSAFTASLNRSKRPPEPPGFPGVLTPNNGAPPKKKQPKPATSNNIPAWVVNIQVSNGSQSDLPAFREKIQKIRSQAFEETMALYDYNSAYDKCTDHGWDLLNLKAGIIVKANEATCMRVTKALELFNQNRVGGIGTLLGITEATYRECQRVTDQSESDIWMLWSDHPFSAMPQIKYAWKAILQKKKVTLVCDALRQWIFEELLKIQNMYHVTDDFIELKDELGC